MVGGEHKKKEKKKERTRAESRQVSLEWKANPVLAERMILFSHKGKGRVRPKGSETAVVVTHRVTSRARESSVSEKMKTTEEPTEQKQFSESCSRLKVFRHMLVDKLQRNFNYLQVN
jgi:hypothetical protein